MPPKRKEIPTLRSGQGSDAFVASGFDSLNSDEISVYVSVLSTLNFSILCTSKRFADIMRAEEVDPNHMKLAATHVVHGKLGLGRFYAAVMQAMMEKSPVMDQLGACAKPHPPPAVLNTLGTITRCVTVMVNSHLDDAAETGASRKMAIMAAMEEMNEFMQTCAMCNSIAEQFFGAVAAVVAGEVTEEFAGEEEGEDGGEGGASGGGGMDVEENEDEDEYTGSEHMAMLIETVSQLQVIKDYVDGISAADLQTDLKYAVSAKAVNPPRTRVEKLLFSLL